MSATYEADFYAWANEQAALLRAGNLSAADIENIAEEIESIGRSEKRELVNRLAVLLLHLLKWQYQPARRGRSWQATIRVQRLALVRHIRDNPSLKSVIPAVLDDAYATAVIEAVGETDLAEAVFPITCSWSFAQIMDSAFWPE